MIIICAKKIFRRKSARRSRSRSSLCFSNMSWMVLARVIISIQKALLFLHLKRFDPSGKLAWLVP